MNIELQSKQCAQIGVQPEDTIQSIFFDFYKKNVPVLSDSDFSFYYTTLIHENSEVPLKIRYADDRRTQFSVNEGNFVLIRLSCRKSYEEFKVLWDIHHDVIVKDDNGFKTRSSDTSLIPAENGNFLIKAKVNWERLVLYLYRPTRVTILLSIGNKYTKIECDELFIFPANFDVQVIQKRFSIYQGNNFMYDNRNGMTMMNYNKPFIRCWGSSAYVNYTCNISMNKYTQSWHSNHIRDKFYDNPLEMLFCYYNDRGELVEHNVVTVSCQNLCKKKVFRNGIITMSPDFPEGTYTVTVSLWGKVLQQSKFLIGKGDD